MIYLYLKIPVIVAILTTKWTISSGSSRPPEGYKHSNRRHDSNF